MSEPEGREFGRYRLVRELGRGGMAVVYYGLDPDGKPVAIKILSRRLIRDPQFTARFQREIQATRALRHPHIVQVYDSGEHKGIPYLVMEYVGGGTLNQVLDQGALQPAIASRLLAQLASALDHAHQQGIIHRDVKPQNVLMASPTEARLTDFGLAKIVGDQAGLTATGAMGTARYMAPEQFKNAAAVDRRADLYALGVILFQMLSGSCPFEGDSAAELMHQHLTAPVPSVREYAPGLPPLVDRVLYKALAKEPNDRFHSGREMVTVFQDVLAGRPVRIALPERMDDLTQPAPDDFGSDWQAVPPGVESTREDLETHLETMRPAHRALFHRALSAYDQGDNATALALLREILEADERAAAAWVLRSYVEANWYDQVQCARNALAVAPDMPDAALRLEQLQAEGPPEGFGRTHSDIPAIGTGRKAAQPVTPQLPAEDDALDNLYQCPYCGVVNDLHLRRCTSCQRSLMRPLPPERQPTPALLTARSLSFGQFVFILFQTLPAFFWTWYSRLEDGSRLKWIMEQLFATDASHMFAGDFYRVLTPEVFTFILTTTLIRAGLVLLVAIGLRLRLIWSFYLGLLVFAAEIGWGMLGFARSWTGSIPGVGGALLALGMLMILSRAAVNFVRTSERYLVRPDARLPNGEAYWQLGKEYERKGMWAMAVAHYRAAVAAAPERAEFYKSLAIGYNELGRLDRAWPALEQARDLAPADKEIPALMQRLATERVAGGRTDRGTGSL